MIAINYRFFVLYQLPNVTMTHCRFGFRINTANNETLQVILQCQLVGAFVVFVLYFH